ncbi:hypothetical protein [Streptomyces sp. NPDC057854]|uniref:hypothetical protein n=1 Tax=unclassified Streptomyces TaxID=2593676 RepID=UPI0036AF2F9D
MRMFTRIACAAATVALGAGIMTAPAATADTATARGTGAGYSAQAGTFHLYKDSWYEGGWEGLTGSDLNLSNNSWDTGGTVNDETTSVKNMTNKYVDLWRHVDGYGTCHGARTTSYPGTEDPNLGNDAIGNDQLTCVKFR